MKTAIYIEEGVTQIALTPEDDTEKRAVELLNRSDFELTVYKGRFYSCQGGWNTWDTGDNHDSIMLRMTRKTQAEDPDAATS